MTARPIFIFLCLASPIRAGDFIRQIQTLANTAVISDIPVSSDSGQVQSKALTADAAVFQLYASTPGPNNTQTITKLDEKTVGTFLPVTSIQALSEDPYFPARTRADMPYGMRVTISGMQADSPTVPASAKSVQVSRGYSLYDPATYQPTSTTGTYADSFTFTGNGIFTASAILQRLPGDRPTKVSGQESFTALIQPDSSLPASELGKATIQIWPVADAKILNLEEGKIYQALPSNGALEIRDLYPKSITYAQLYKGPQATGSTGIPLPSTVVSYNTYLPQNANLPLTDLPGLLSEDGEYTLEVLTITPFNGGAPELLTKVSFRIKRTISVNSMITTIE